MAKKVFGLLWKAEIVTLIGGIICRTAGSLYEGNGVVTQGVKGGVLVGLAICAAGFIMQLVALNKGKNMHKYLKTAFFMVIAAFVLSTVNQLGVFGSFSDIVGDVCSNVAEVLVAVFVIYAIVELSKQAGNAELQKLAEKTGKLYTVICFIGVISGSLASDLVKSVPAAGIALLVFILVAYCFYLKLLVKASKSL